MRKNRLIVRTDRRGFVKWFAVAIPAIASLSLLQRSVRLAYVRLDSHFLLVDGWVLPSAYFD